MQIERYSEASHTLLRRTQPLTTSNMRAVAPAMFLPVAPSIRFDPPRTSAAVGLLEHLHQSGFDVFEAGQSRSCNLAGRDYTRFVLRLRHRDRETEDDVNEVVLLGGVERNPVYSVFAGVCRDACQNDLVCVTPVRQVLISCGSEDIRLIGLTAVQVLEDFPIIDAQKAAMKRIWLDPLEQRAFACAAKGLMQDAEGRPCPISELHLLRIERAEDDASDLWTTLNRVHEHVIRGGVLLRQPDGRRTRTRGVRSIDDSVKLSRALWRLAEAMCELKVA